MIKSAVFKAITWVIAIVGLGASIIMGVAFPVNSYNSITGDFVTSNFNSGLMFSGLVGTVILCLIFGGITCILGYLEELGAGKASADETDNETEPSKINKSSNDKWECPECHSMNSYKNNPECYNCHWRP